MRRFWKLWLWHCKYQLIAWVTSIALESKTALQSFENSMGVREIVKGFKMINQTETRDEIMARSMDPGLPAGHAPGTESSQQWCINNLPLCKIKWVSTLLPIAQLNER